MGSIVKKVLGDDFTRIGSNIAGLFFIWRTLRAYFPRHLKITIQQLLHNAIQKLPFFKKCSEKILSFYSPYTQIRIREIEECRYNRAYTAIKTYLCAKVNSEVRSLRASQRKDKSLDIKRDDDTIEEEYEGKKMWWEFVKCPKGNKACRLTFHKGDYDVVTASYLTYAIEKGKSIEEKKKKNIKLFMNNPGSNWKLSMKHLWTCIDFEHPATFDTMAVNAEKKDEIMRDLLAFRDGKEYYNKIGKAWKRGYLLYGPPGTGKSTMIAAMANLMNYNIFDLELTSIENNWELKKLLIATTSKSIIVIEDIDCSLDLTGERKDRDESKREGKTNAVTLSGLLNFIDGIWSACGQERILVFTTNHLGKLDEALIRKGRMDMHIELSYCTFDGFKILAKNYLNIDSHPLFGKIESLLEETNITPADVAEKLMVKDSQLEVDGSLKGLIRTLEKMVLAQKRRESEQHEEINQI